MRTVVGSGEEAHGHAAKLWDQVEVCVAEGKSKFALWEYGRSTLELIRRFRASGLLHLCCAVIDERKEVQGTQTGVGSVRGPEYLRSNQVDVLVIGADAEKERVLQCAAEYLGPARVRILLAGTGHLAYRNPALAELAGSAFVSSRAAGYPHMLVHLFQSVNYLVKSKIKGDVAELGVYKAGTTVLLARMFERLQWPYRIYAFDTFAGFPGSRHTLDLYDASHDEYTVYEVVAEYCKPYNITLVRGDIRNTYEQLAAVDLALTFVDTDNYSPTRAALELIVERTVPGGVIAFDHYFCDERWNYTIGERIAAREVLDGRGLFHLHGTGVFVKGPTGNAP